MGGPGLARRVAGVGRVRRPGRDDETGERGGLFVTRGSMLWFRRREGSHVRGAGSDGQHVWRKKAGLAVAIAPRRRRRCKYRAGQAGRLARDFQHVRIDCRDGAVPGRVADEPLVRPELFRELRRSRDSDPQRPRSAGRGRVYDFIRAGRRKRHADWSRRRAASFARFPLPVRRVRRPAGSRLF